MTLDPATATRLAPYVERALAGEADLEVVAGLAMGAGQILGAALGSRLAMRFGSRLIRPLLIIMSLALTAKMLLDPANPIHRLLFG